MIVMNKKELLNAVRDVKRFCAKNTILPVLNCIHIKACGNELELTATDCTSSARVVLSTNNTADYDFCINADKTESIINALNEDITIELDNNSAIITDGITKFKLPILDSAEFPKINFNLSDNQINFQKDDFITGINNTVFCTSTIQQHILSGICINFLQNTGVDFVSTDGNRLSIKTFENENIKANKKITVMSDFLGKIAKTIDDNVTFSTDDKKITFMSGNSCYTTSLLEGTFPDYKPLIPNALPLKVLLNRKEMLTSLEQITIMCDARRELVIFDFTPNKLLLTAHSENGDAKKNIDIDFAGEIRIGFNCRYILDVLRNMITDNIIMEFNTSLGACIIKGDFTYLVMPIQLES